jgi:hypothetical protein
MAVGEGEAAQARPVRRRRRLRITVIGLLGLVCLAAITLYVYRRNLSPVVKRPAIDAIFKKVSPAADGAIGKREYGPPVTMAWTKDDTLAAFHHYLLDPATKGYFHGHSPRRVRAPCSILASRSPTTMPRCINKTTP